MTKSRALLELTFAGVLWGFGFIGTIWSLRFLSPSAILFYRFMMAFIVGGVLVLLKRPSKQWLLHELWISLSPGVLLWLSLFLQTSGLQYTTATKSAFITTLYVIIVPLIRALTKEEKLQWQHWFCVGLAMVGTGFIVQIHESTVLNWGDLLTLLCAVFAAVHILVVGQQTLKTKHDLAFNTFQSFWISFFSLMVFPFSTNWQLAELDLKAWIGLLILGLGASLIAFLMQVRAQKVLSPSVASLMFLLESPFSFIFAFLLLGEKLNLWQWLGAFLILTACGLISFSKRAPAAHL